MLSLKMEFKKILSRLKTSKEERKEMFLALEICYEAVKSAVWTVKNGQPAVLKIGSTEEWEEENKKSLLRAADSSISNAFEGIDPEPDKVIFGLPENWVKGEKIVEEKKELLKELCDKLELKPLGFVVILEALTAFLKAKEGTPVSAIFVNLSETQSIISLVYLGKIVGSQIVGRSEDLAADVREGLARFGEIKNLPSRMILFNGVADFEEAKQQIISFDWQEQLPFLHFPKVEVLDIAASVRAVALAGGAEVAKSLGFEIKEDETEEGEEKTEEKEPLEKEEAIKEKEEVTAADLGFIQNKDVAEEDLLQGKKRKVKRPPAIKEPDFSLSKEAKTEKKRIFSRQVKKQLISFFTFVPRAAWRLGAAFFRKGSFLLFLPAIFFLLAGAGLAFYWYVPRAEITIYLRPKTLAKEVEVMIDPQISQIDKEKEVIPGRFKQIEVEGEKSKKTTGERLIGDKAEGEVTIYNKTEVAKTFPQGTVLVGPDKLTFILKEEIFVASQSASTDENEVTTITPGQAKAKIIAASIGAESNLAASTKLSFKDYASSLFSAKTEEGLSGGSSRQVQAVSSDDLDDLLQQLIDELTQKAQEQLKNSLSPEEEVLGKAIETTIVNKEFSAQKGEEAEDLKLKLKIKFNFLVYRQSDLAWFLKEKIKTDIPQGFIFDEQMGIDIEEVKKEGDQVKIKAAAQLNLLPQLNKEEIKNNIRGHYPQAIESYLASLTNFSRADIKINPSLPAKLKTLPRISKNIKVIVKIEE